MPLLHALLAALAYSAPPLLAGTNMTKCLAANCMAEVKACAADTSCTAGLHCVGACKKPITESCAELCIEAHLDLTMMSLGACATAAGCLPKAVRAAAASAGARIADKMKRRARRRRRTI